MKSYFLLLDLKDDPEKIYQYEQYHKSIPPKIRESILNAGITKMDIFRFENRLVMHMETLDSFSFEKKEAMDKSNEEVQNWEQLMSKFQQIIPGTPDGHKWVITNKIFEL
jgi:L-rhamnose mutarotase